MDTTFSKAKKEVLNNIFAGNDIVIFVGYACNDNDVYNSLIEISKNEEKKPTVIWVKRTDLEKKCNIYNILSAFHPDKEPTEYIYKSDSYSFFLALFSHFIDREKINLPLIKEQTEFISEKISKEVERTTINFHKEPITDIVHENIKFPEEYRENIFKIINSCDMQRLRDIKQLSFAQYKFPSATHSRFSHSLGVAYLVSQTLTTNSNFSDINKNDVKNTIYAALLHDVGHGPLGHVLDKFYDRRGKSNEHEEFTTKFIDEGLIDLNKILKDVDLNLNFIKNLILFKIERDGHRKRDLKNIFLAWLITDYALDLDRIDFLIRDQVMTNHKTNCRPPVYIQQQYSHETLEYQQKELSYNEIVKEFISCLNVATFDELDDSLKSKFSSDVKILYLDNKGKCKLEDLLSYLLNLYVEMYTNVYYNDKIASAEAMMAKALNIAYDMGDIDRSSLYTFTDSEMFAYLEKLENDLIRELVYSVKYRKFFREIIEFDLDIPDDVNANTIEEKIIGELKINPNDFNNLIIVNIPRKKEIKNLYVKNEYNRIIVYPKLSVYKKKFASIKGKIFVNPHNEYFFDVEGKEKIVKILGEMGIKSNLIGIRETNEPDTVHQKLDNFFEL